VLKKSLTIVLPVHNAESQLRRNVSELLELASELTAKFGVLIIDDGSTDATYEVAEELAAHYPQVSVQRYGRRRGLGAAMEYIRRRVRTDAVIIHDGVTPIDSRQVRSLWERWAGRPAQSEHASAVSHHKPSDICDFANLPAIHAAMERAHGQVIGFQLMTMPPTDKASSDTLRESSNALRDDARRFPHRVGVGQIPRLPRPKFLSALAEFALGE
jgi:hypothetical protein